MSASVGRGPVAVAKTVQRETLTVGCCCLPFAIIGSTLGSVLSLLGLGLGIFSITRVKGDPSLKGKELAWTGIALSAVGLLMTLAVVLMFVLGMAGHLGQMGMQGY